MPPSCYRMQRCKQMKTNTVIAQTKKGHRVFLEGLSAHGWVAGSLYSVSFEQDHIVLALDHDNGKRKVVASKGGVIDLESKKVTRWADGATTAIIAHDRERGCIIIGKA